MTGLSDLHFDYQACRILTVIDVSGHIKHLAKELHGTRKAKIASSETFAAINTYLTVTRTVYTQYVGSAVADRQVNL